jgi:hypothetical protein
MNSTHAGPSGKLSPVKLLGALLLLTGLAPLTTNAATITVSPGQSIQAAIDYARAGDTVLVKAGTYTGGVEINKDNIRLVSEVSAGAHIVGAGTPAVQAYGQHNIAVIGFRLTADDQSDGVKIGGVPGKNSTGVIFQNNILERSGKDGFKFFHLDRLTLTGNVIKTAGLLRNANGDGGIDWVNVNYSTVSNNVVQHTYGHACFMMKGGSHHSTVENNIFARCERDGVTVGGFTSGDAAIEVIASGYENHDNIIRNNTIEGGVSKCAFYFRLEARNTLSGNKLTSGATTCSTRGGGGTGARITALNDNFEDGNHAGWTVVNEGSIDGPSVWTVLNGKLIQSANIYGPDVNASTHRRGTFAYYSSLPALTWTNYSMQATLRSSDDDGMGVMVRYQNPSNYYKIDIDRQRNFRRLFKVKNGVETLLASTVGGFAQNIDMTLKVTVVRNQITATLNGANILGGTITDNDLGAGTAALYCWGNQSCTFDNVTVDLQ